MEQTKGKQWKDQAPACGWYISYLYRSTFTWLVQKLKKVGLSGSQSVILVGIYRNEGTNQKALAEEIAMTPGVMSRTLRELEDAGYVEKKRDEENRRNYRLYLTPEGERTAEKSLSIQENYWNCLLEDLTPEETGMLNRLLGKMELRARQENKTAGSLK